MKRSKYTPTKVHSIRFIYNYPEVPKCQYSSRAEPASAPFIIILFFHLKPYIWALYVSNYKFVTYVILCCFQIDEFIGERTDILAFNSK